MAFTIADLKAMTEVDTRKGRVRSVLTPGTPLACPSAPASNVLSGFYENCFVFFEKSDYPQDLKALLFLMMSEGLRVTEALNILPSDVTKSGKIRVKGIKGSSDRLLTISNYKDFWQSYRRGKLSFRDVYDRFFIYRICKKNGLMLGISGSNKSAVTHSFRYAYLKQLQAEGVELTLSSKAIGHKSVNTTKGYVSK